MPANIVAEVRAECNRLGIPFEVVRDCKAAIEEAERASREREWEIRQTAWSEAVGPGSWPFWRFGFRARWGRRYDERDCTAIPQYDEIHQLVASRFPEFAEGDGEHRLFELLFSEYRPLTPKADLWWQALAQVQHQAGARDWSNDPEPSFCDQEF